MGFCPPWQPRRRALEVALLRADAGSDVVQPHVGGWAVRDVLGLLAAEGSVLLAIDDAQWFDSASASAVSFALRRPESLPVGLLATCRGVGGLCVNTLRTRDERRLL